MSEEILTALIELFAILSRQGSSVTQKQLTFVRDYLKPLIAEGDLDRYYFRYVELLGTKNKRTDEGTFETSPLDSVEIIRICYQINSTLNQDQKIILLVKCIELVQEQGSFAAQDEILSTCAEIFNIEKSEYTSILRFVQSSVPDKLAGDEYLVINQLKTNSRETHHIEMDLGVSTIAVLFLERMNMYFIKIAGSGNAWLNGNTFIPDRIYSLPRGAVITFSSSHPLYFSTIASVFKKRGERDKLCFEAKDVTWKFSDGSTGLQKCSFSVSDGQLVAIMGGSGSGKTTLLSILAGFIRPTTGKILLNGRNILDKSSKSHIGYVSQDDLLIEELTVFQNLYYSSQLVFGNLDKAELTHRVHQCLKELDLFQVKDLRVGSVHDKILSGGQRKRLNIGLELIRNPEVLFLDEPISGLSSKDSEKVIFLLSELCSRGRLIFTVIHQPSSDIYRQFDKIIIVDQGGYCIYYGNPIEALTYFRSSGKRINRHIIHCANCGTVQPQEMFDIIEEKVLDEYGIESENRKVSPKDWHRRFLSETENRDKSGAEEEPPDLPANRIKKATLFQQFRTYLTRDVLAKISNGQYLLLIVLEPVLLSLILSYLVRRSDTDGGKYIFMSNNNIPAFIFMSIVVIIFIGLTMSAEELFRDRKIRIRERLLQLNRSSYLGAKLVVLFTLSAVQCLVFVCIGNSILEIRDSILPYWVIVFSVACNANLIGLNISGAFKSAVTIYILIPLLIIPQMILGGAMFGYENLNASFEDRGFAPGIASVIPARWAYEALMTHQFVNNRFESKFYDLDQKISHLNYKQGVYLTELYKMIDECLEETNSKDSPYKKAEQPEIIYREINSELDQLPEITIGKKPVYTGEFSEIEAASLKGIINEISHYYRDEYNRIRSEKDRYISQLSGKSGSFSLEQLKLNHHNQQLARTVKNSFQNAEVLRTQTGLQRISEPIFIDNSPSGGLFSKYQFFTPVKYFANLKLSTFWYNTSVLWAMNVLLFILLYLDLVKGMVGLLN